MAEESAQEKTEEATPKRQQTARERGTIARSRELNTCLILLIGGAAVWGLADRMMSDLQAVARTAWEPGRERLMDAQLMMRVFADAIQATLVSIAPLLAITFIVAMIAPVLLGGFNFSPSVLVFSWEKLNPLTNYKRVFGFQGLVELVKSIVKFAIVFAVTWWVLSGLVGEFIGLGSEPLEQGIYHLGRLMMTTFLWLSAALVLVVVVDVPFQIWTTNKQLRMTLQEVRDDFKESDGKPEVKQRIRAMQLERSQRRMMANVPTADVVITNPTHYAVALKYDAKTMRAPILVAKGADLVAAEIRRIAQAKKIPILSSPALARAIFFSTELEAEIPVGLYKAVAMVLAYIVQIKAKKTRPQWHTGLSLNDVPIPDEYRRPP